MTPPADVLAALERLQKISPYPFMIFGSPDQYKADIALVAAHCQGGERARVIEECERLVLSKPAGYSALWVAGDLAAILRALLPPAAAPTEGRDG